MDYPVEFGAVTADAFVQSKYFDKIYGAVTGHHSSDSNAQPNKPPAAVSDTQRSKHHPEDPAPRQKPASAAASSHRSQRYASASPHRYDIDEESQQSEQVLREYEAERDDPKRKPSASLVARSLSLRQAKDRRRDSVRMSHANGGYGRSERPTSQRGGSRYDDYYDDEYESDYDDRTGRRTRTTGRGYDAERDREFDREIIETERYRGVSPERCSQIVCAY
jgi:type IV secretory pathway VirB10-like protein